MTIDPQVLRSGRHIQVGRLIQRDATILIERWAQRAAQEQPNAARVHKDVLLDQLPRLLDLLGQGLADSLHPDASPHSVPAAEHGEQRWESGWSLSEVVRDYQILRLVVFEYLEENIERPLHYQEIQAVGLALDEAITASVAAYVRQREEHVQQVEGQRAEEQRRAEETQHRWDRIFQNAGWGIAILSPEGVTLQAVNPAFARMHGCTMDEMVGQPFADTVAPEARASLLAHLQESTTTHTQICESVQLRKDRTCFPALVQAAVITDTAGSVLHYALNVQDITAHKKLEESLRVQAEALREADKRKTEFLAMLAHELRNPLAPMLNSVEVLRLLGSENPTVTRARDIFERQVKQMTRMVDDLLDVTRIAQGKIELRRTIFDLATAVNQAIQTTTPLFEAQQHKLSVSLPTEPLRLEADLARVVQVLVNVLNNAGKYTDRGGQITLTGSREGDEVIVRVRDNGMGIEPEMLGRVFDLFTQVDRSLTRAQGGLGIGLTLVRQLVDLHGGRVSAHSDGSGKGSEFELRLPALPPGPVEDPARTTNTNPSSSCRHILIIEDNEDARTTLETLLRLLGHRVAGAATGPEGITRVLAERPQVALIDLGLPGLDGYQVARKLRQELGSEVILVALTGHAQEEDRRRAREAGFDAYLVKPVEMEELNQLLAGIK